MREDKGYIFCCPGFFPFIQARNTAEKNSTIRTVPERFYRCGIRVFFAYRTLQPYHQTVSFLMYEELKCLFDKLIANNYLLYKN